MRDFPVFTTEYGVASLVLREIPYQQAAYITLQSTLEPEKLLQECVSFCRACGAEAVYAKGHPYLEAYPLYTAMWELRCPRASIADTDAALWPVQEQTVAKWQEIYNEKVVKLPNGAWMDGKAAREMLQKGDGYFIHRGEELLGIGRACGDTVDWVAAVRKGAGREVVQALCHALTEDTVKLTVASVNEKALALYESLGFIRAREISRWYRVL